MRTWIALPLAVFLLATTWLRAEEAQDGQKPKVVDYPGVNINLETRQVRVSAVLSDELMWGAPLLEYIMMNGKEKGYETLFITEANPSHVQLGLILLGLRPGKMPATLLENPGRPESYPADMPPLVQLSVEWTKKDGTTASLPLEKLIRYRKNDQHPDRLDFAFTGSEFVADIEGKTVLGAELTGEVATMLYNPLSILNLSYYEISPYNEVVSGFEVEIAGLPEELRAVRKMEIDGKGIVDMIIPKATDVVLIFAPRTEN